MPQPAPPVPQIPAGYGPVPADFTLWVTDSFSFLSQMPVFRARRAAALTMAVNAYTVMAYDTVDEDPYGGWNSSSHVWTCPAGCAGWYEASLNQLCGSQGSGSGNQNVAVLVLNGSIWMTGPDDWAPSSAEGGASGSVQVPLLPGDTVQVWGFANGGGTTPTTAGQQPAIELTWVSS